MGLGSRSNSAEEIAKIIPLQAKVIKRATLERDHFLTLYVI